MITEMIKQSWISQQKNVKIAVLSIGLAAIAFSAWSAYQFYSIYQSKKAQLILSECLDEYQKMFESNVPSWQDAILMSNLGFEQAQATPSLQPFFLVIQAQALARQGNNEQAVVLMDQALNLLDDALPYKNYYTLTKSLIQLDAQDEAVKDAGFAQLQQLAADSNNLFQDAALYYLACYYRAQHDMAKAQEMSQQLIDGMATTFKDSPWAQKIKEHSV